MLLYHPLELAGRYGDLVGFVEVVYHICCAFFLVYSWLVAFLLHIEFAKLVAVSAIFLDVIAVGLDPSLKIAYMLAVGLASPASYFKETIQGLDVIRRRSNEGMIDRKINGRYVVIHNIGL
jgi:hypothetical protein